MNAPPGEIQIVVAYDSGSRGSPALRGRTAVPAAAIARGARGVQQTRVQAIHLGEQQPDWDALDTADAVVFGCPTYMGSGSARMKAFMEESLRPQFLERRWQDKLAAGFTNSAGMSGDKLCTLQQLAGFAAQHGMIWIPLGQLPGWQSSTGSPADPNRLSSFLGLMAQSNSDQGPDHAPPDSDRRTGELFGRHIAHLTHQWAATLPGVARGPARRSCRLWSPMKRTYDNGHQRHGRAGVCLDRRRPDPSPCRAERREVSGG
jgi:NAD(P)H dehydrogenase (quinone)